MNWKNNLQAFRHHLFVGVTLLGCVAPWVTPRHFPVHSVPLRTLYQMTLTALPISAVPVTPDLTETIFQESRVQFEVVQSAC